MTKQQLQAVVIGILAGVGVAVGLAWWSISARPSTEGVRDAVVTTIQRETPESFYVTGVLDITAERSVEETQSIYPELFAAIRQLQPAWPGLDRGTARANVKLSGRVSYGFALDSLRREDIQVGEEGVIEVRIPLLAVHAVEANLETMEIRSSEEGWMQLFDSEVKRQVQQQAMQGAQEALREQAQRRLDESTQPRINTARALETMLTPALEAAGIENPRFRFQIGSNLVLEPEG